MAKKRLATGITFDASEKTVVHADFSDITLAGIQLIVNVTDQIIIYNFADTTKGGTLSTDTLTLEYDTTSMSDTDELMILVEDGVASQAVNDGGSSITVDGSLTVDLGANNDVTVTSGTITAELSAVDNAVLDTIDAVLDTIKVDTEAIETAVEAIQAAQLPDGHNVTIDNPGDIGGGVQYTEGDEDASITGTAMMMEVAADILEPVQGTVADGLLVNLGANNDVTVSGVSTAAKQDTIIGHVDGIEGLLTTIDADTGTIATEVAGLLTDTELRATPVPVSGTVTVTATNLDVQSGGADLATTTQAGAIQTAVELIDNTIYTDDADFSDGVSVGQGVMAVAEGTPTTVTDGDMGMLSMSTSRHLKVVATASDALLSTIDADTGNLPTIETNTDFGTVIGGGTGRPALRVTIANNSTGVLSVDDNGSTLSIDDGGGVITVDGTVAVSGSVTVDLGANNDVTVTSGAITETNSGGIQTAVQLIDDVIYVDDADWTDSTSKHALVGGLYQTSPQSVTDGDVAPFQIDNNGNLKVKNRTSTTPGQTTVAGSASSVTVLALNASRLGASIFNDSTAVLYLKLGATASTTSYTVKMPPDSLYEVPFGYTGVIDGIWASATGNARITELT